MDSKVGVDARKGGRERERDNDAKEGQQQACGRGNFPCQERIKEHKTKRSDKVPVETGYQKREDRSFASVGKSGGRDPLLASRGRPHGQRQGMSAAGAHTRP